MIPDRGGMGLVFSELVDGEGLTSAFWERFMLCVPP